MLNLIAMVQTQAAQAATQTAASDNATILRHMSEALHQSFYRVLSLLIAVLPGLLAFFVALALFAAVGAGVSAVLKWLLRAVRFDDRLAKTRGTPDWAPASGPTEIAGRASFWGCVLLGLIVGVSAFDASFATAGSLPIVLLPYLTHAVGAIFILIAGTLIARFLARTVLIGAVNAQLEYARFLSLGVKWLVLVLTAAMALDHLEVGGVVVSLAFGILFGGIVLTLALAVGLGSRELVSKSLESRVERINERMGERMGERTGESAATMPPTGTTGETIRHF
jgi:hypothetical protein